MYDPKPYTDHVALAYDRDDYKSSDFLDRLIDAAEDEA